jgi:putative chitinase
MGVIVSLEQIIGLAPTICPAYREAFGQGQDVLERYGIAATPLRMAHFVAQTLHESAAYTLLFENLNYSAARLPVVWPTQFWPTGTLDPGRYAYQPELLANAVYGGRMGNVAPQDGYTYRGRGMLQLTGRGNYADATTQVRRRRPDAPDFVADPQAVTSAGWCLHVAAAIWNAKGCNAAADRDDVAALTARINGGAIGLAERIEWTRRTRAVWCREQA